jgi:hypothetical protein
VLCQINPRHIDSERSRDVTGRPVLQNVKVKDLKLPRVDLASDPLQGCRYEILLPFDDEAPRLLYDRLKMEEARGRRLRNEIDTETMRLKPEAPALEVYESFRETLANKCNDKPHRHELRRALAALLETIVLDPHGKDGIWCFTVHLKGAGEAVEIVGKAKPESWRHQGRRPSDFARLNEKSAAA